MSTRKISSVVGIATAVLLILVGGSATISSAAQTIPSIFRATLEGSQVVPMTVDSDAKGSAIFRSNNDGTELEYKVRVANIEDVIAAHIHLAPKGTSGPVAVFLFNPEAPTDGRTNGILAKGTITSADLVGGVTLSELIDKIEAGNAYVDVHTVEYPGGEIRGQIS